MESIKAERVNVEALRAELAKVGQDSVTVTRRGDFRAVARLTAQAAHINAMISGKEHRL
jgi:hypothetical protein